MKLNNENYFSPEAMNEYLSCSQYKDFMGTLGKIGCEAQAVAKLKGEWSEEKSTALLVGGYVDAHFEGTLDLYKGQNPEIFMKNGGLKAEYRNAEEIISRIERDKFFMENMSGEKQVIMEAELFGSKWKVKIDSYHPGKAIVDLKVMKSLRDRFYIKDLGSVGIIENWGYDLQGAIYQEVVYQNTGERLPFFIAGASKEKVTDIEVAWIPDNILKEKLVEIERNTPNIVALKKGELEPVRCEVCDYCKSTKVLTKAIHYTELLGEI